MSVYDDGLKMDELIKQYQAEHNCTYRQAYLKLAELAVAPPPAEPEPPSKTKPVKRADDDELAKAIHFFARAKVEREIFQKTREVIRVHEGDER